MKVTSKTWTLFDRDGYIQQHGVEVADCGGGTTRINGTLHRTDELVISDTEIRSTVAGWYLQR